MRRMSKVEFEVKVAAVKDYLNGVKSIQKISDELSVSKSSVRAQIRIHQSKGESGLFPQLRNTVYSKELKMVAVEDYLAGNGSLMDISMKYGLCSKTQLLSWTIKYKSGKD